MQFDGVNFAVSSSALVSGDLPQTAIIDSVVKNFQPRRPGDIYLLFDPQRFIHDFDGLTVACAHGPPWRYDTFAPLMFAGPGMPATTVNRMLPTVGIAPKLSRLLNIKAPSGAQQGPLTEVLGD